MNLLQIRRATASLGLHLGENPNSWRNSRSSGLSSSLVGRNLGIVVDGVAPASSKFLVTKETKKKIRMMIVAVAVASSGDGFADAVNLNEYMVTLEKPLLNRWTGRSLCML